MTKGKNSLFCLYYNQFEQDDLKIIKAKVWKISLNDNIITGSVDNIVAKGEIARCKHFLLLNQYLKNCLFEDINAIAIVEI